MTSLIQPICYPQYQADEAPMGYLIRVCEANHFNNVRWLYPEEGEPFVHLPSDILDRLHESPWTGASEISSSLQPYINLKNIDLNYTVLRYCPECLAEDPYYRVGWQLRSSVACTKHKCWLLDSCSSCGKQQLLGSKSAIDSCKCEAKLSKTPSPKAPDSVIRYQQFIDGDSEYFDGQNFWLAKALKKLNLPIENRTLLARFFGHWQPIECNRLDQTGSFAGFADMDTAKPYAISLGEAYFSSPEGFHAFLDRIHHHVYVDQEQGDTLFKRFYRSFFKHFANEIEPLHEEFTNYLNQNWRHPLSNKNTLFSESAVESHSWLALQTVSKRYEIPKSELKKAIKLGEIRSEKKYFEDTDRTLVSLYVTDVHKYLSKIRDQVNGVTAASILGVTKKQFYQLVDSHLLQGQSPSEISGALWSFNRKDLNGFLERFTETIPVIDDEFIPFPHALRKIGNRIDQPIVGLLKAIETGDIRTRRKSELVGLRSLYVAEQDLMDWYRKMVNDEREGLYTIEELARSMCVSDHLIRQLINRGLLQVFNRGKKEVRCISAKSVDEFKERYVLFTKLSQQSGLALHEIRPLLKAHKIFAIDHHHAKNERLMNRIFYRHDLINIREISTLVGAQGDWDYMD